MSGNTDLQVGTVRPDGTRPVTGADGAGLFLRGDVDPEPTAAGGPPRALSAAEIGRLAAIAGRAPSVHNTQPWKIRASASVIDLLADPRRQLHQIDPAGREMLISCGAALLGLRLGLRALGLVPAVSVLPEKDEPLLVASVRIAGRAPISRHESELLAAVHHRHTHRGPFAPGDVPPRLMDGLRADAVAHETELAVLQDQAQVSWLSALVKTAAQAQTARPEIDAELRRWTRPAGSSARDGVPAFARLAMPGQGPYRAATAGLQVPQRDFGAGGTLPAGGAPPPVTAVLTTADDAPADWIRAGQSLHRLLLHAASRWVFASLQSQPLELAPLRAELAAELKLPGAPQMILQLGRSNTAAATARRPVSEILI